MRYSPETTALIPVFNDDYSLFLCIQSVAPVVDEVWINDDGSTDKTHQVIEWALTTYANVRAHKMSKQTGWIDSFNSLFSLTNARYVFRIDADDIMYPDASLEIEKMKEETGGCFMLGIQECWGDFHHSRRDLEINWDATHIFVDREKCDFVWTQGRPPQSWPVASTSVGKKKWHKRLFFHMPGVKSDQRLILRTMMNGWHTAGRPCPLEQWPSYRKLSRQEIHQKALRWLFFDRNQNRELTQIPVELIPQVCLANERFELIKNSKGFYVDRVDNGWLFDPGTKEIKTG